MSQKGGWMKQQEGSIRKRWGEANPRRQSQANTNREPHRPEEKLNIKAGTIERAQEKKRRRTCRNRDWRRRTGA